LTGSVTAAGSIPAAPLACESALPPSEFQARFHRFKLGAVHSGHFLQLVQVLETPVLFAIPDNGFGLRRGDFQNILQFRGGRLVYLRLFRETRSQAVDDGVAL